MAKNRFSNIELLRIILMIIIRKLRKINLKSLILNFRLFKFKTALKMPILVNKKTKVKGIKKGIIILPDVVTTGMIQIGFSDIDFISEKDTLTSLNISEKGKLVIKGKLLLELDVRYRSEMVV